VERRTFLVLGAAALGLAGCTVDPAPPAEPSPTPPPVPDRDADLRARVAASEAALVAAYRDILSAAPGLADRIEGFADHHLAHLARVAPDVDAEALVTAAGSGSPTSTASAPGAGGSGSAGATGDATGAAEPVDVAALLARLAAAEARAHADRLTSCDSATSTALARDLCLIAASEAQHEQALTRLGERKGAS
jgi:hypothetical protein